MEVLVDRRVGFVDEVHAFIQESGRWLSHDRAMELVHDKYKFCSRDEMGIAVRAELIRYREEVEGPAFDALRERKAGSAAAAGGGGVRKEPLTFSCDSEEEDDYYRYMLDGQCRSCGFGGRAI